jgi:hypothetical protein
MRPFTTSRITTVRLPPPRLPGGMSGSTSSHSAPVRSLGYRNLPRPYRPRFFAVHIGGPPSNQAATLESQVIHRIQYLSGRTLKPKATILLNPTSVFEKTSNGSARGWHAVVKNIGTITLTNCQIAISDCVVCSPFQLRPGEEKSIKFMQTLEWLLTDELRTSASYRSYALSRSGGWVQSTSSTCILPGRHKIKLFSNEATETIIEFELKHDRDWSIHQVFG